MKKLILTFMTFVTFVVTTHAEQLPSLEGLGAPSIGETQMEDPSFPAYLERIGDKQSAILEWQRIIYETTDPALKARGHIQLARLQINTGAYHKAMNTLQNISDLSAGESYIPEALYLMSIVSDLTKNYTDGDIYRKRIQKLYPESGYLEQAERHTLWHRGLQGLNSFPEVYTAKAQALKTRLELHPATNATQANLASIISLIPGAGHVYLGDFRTGLMAFFINAILIWALISALKTRHWAYSTFFGLIVCVMYVGTMFSAHSLAQRTAYESRFLEMHKWGDLAPKTVAPLKPLFIAYSEPLRAPLWAYRNIIGTFDGERGNGAPVNSYYAKQAMDKHGIALGTGFMIDRLLRDWREIEMPIAETYADGRRRYMDPLKRNDFWLKS